MMSCVIPSGRLFQPNAILKPRLVNSEAIQKIQQSSLPVWLEIGAGAGMNARSQAQQHLNTHYIAIERTKTKFDTLMRTVLPLNIPNLIPVHADAIAWVTYFLSPLQLSKIFILYPNPEPHNKNQRWLNMPFFEFLLSRLKDNGTIHLASNIESYIDEAALLAKNHWQLDVEQSVVTGAGRTHFEKKYLERQHHCRELILTKPIGYTTRFDSVNGLGLKEL